MKNTLIIIISLAISQFELSAQDISKNPQFLNGKTSDIQEFFFKNFNLPANRILTDTMCISNVTFMKFNIDVSGKVENVEFNASSNKRLDSLFTSIIKASNGLWKPATMNNNPQKSMPLILPLFYEVTRGCQPDGSNKVLSKFYFELLDAVHDFGYTTSLHDPNGLSCILLRGCRITPYY